MSKVKILKDVIELSHLVIELKTKYEMVSEENKGLHETIKSQKQTQEALIKKCEKMREALEAISAPDMWEETYDGYLDWRGVEDFMYIAKQALEEV